MHLALEWASISTVQLRMLACGEREATVMAPPSMHDSAASPCLHGCLAFLHRHFPPQSPPSHPLDLCLCSQQQLSPGDGSTFPKLQLQLLRLPGDLRPCLGYVCTAAERTLWFSFHLGCHRSAVSPSALTVSPLTQTIALIRGSDPCLSSPTRQGQVQSY